MSDGSGGGVAPAKHRGFRVRHGCALVVLQGPGAVAAPRGGSVPIAGSSAQLAGRYWPGGTYSACSLSTSGSSETPPATRHAGISLRELLARRTQVGAGVGARSGAAPVRGSRWRRSRAAATTCCNREATMRSNSSATGVSTGSEISSSHSGRQAGPPKRDSVHAIFPATKGKKKAARRRPLTQYREIRRSAGRIRRTWRPRGFRRRAGRGSPGRCWSGSWPTRP